MPGSQPRVFAPSPALRLELRPGGAKAFLQERASRDWSDSRSSRYAMRLYHHQAAPLCFCRRTSAHGDNNATQICAKASCASAKPRLQQPHLRDWSPGEHPSPFQNAHAELHEWATQNPTIQTRQRLGVSNSGQKESRASHAKANNDIWSKTKSQARL